MLSYLIIFIEDDEFDKDVLKEAFLKAYSQCFLWKFWIIQSGFILKNNRGTDASLMSLLLSLVNMLRCNTYYYHKQLSYNPSY